MSKWLLNELQVLSLLTVDINSPLGLCASRALADADFLHQEKLVKAALFSDQARYGGSGYPKMDGL